MDRPHLCTPERFKVAYERAGQYRRFQQPRKRSDSFKRKGIESRHSHGSSHLEPYFEVQQKRNLKLWLKWDHQFANMRWHEAVSTNLVNKMYWSPERSHPVLVTWNFTRASKIRRKICNYTTWRCPSRDRGDNPRKYTPPSQENHLAFICDIIPSGMQKISSKRALGTKEMHGAWRIIWIQPPVQCCYVANIQFKRGCRKGSIFIKKETTLSGI